MKAMIRKPNHLMDIPSIFDDFFVNDWNSGSQSRMRMPAVNVLENENEFKLELSVPGFSKEDFSVELENDVLSISSELSSENESSADGYTRKEFSRYSFKRNFTLPLEKVETDGIDVKYENGILAVSIPKREEAKAKPARKLVVA